MLQETEGFKEFEFPLGESLAGGVFLGAGLLHLLPDASQEFFKAGYTYPFSFLIAALSFLILLFLEHLSHSMKHRGHSLFLTVTLLPIIMLSLHSLLEGAAIGLAENFLTGLIIFLAIIVHKGAEGFALSINLNRSHLSRTLAILIFIFFALMTPLGIFAGSIVVSSTTAHHLLAPIFTSLAAGTFLYIGTLHGLDRASLIRHCCNLKEFMCMLFGFSVMALVAIWA